MTDPDYAPFPEQELTALMGWHTQASRLWKEGSQMHRDHARRAQVCKDALLAHTAMRERMLIAETERRIADVA